MIQQWKFHFNTLYKEDEKIEDKKLNQMLNNLIFESKFKKYPIIKILNLMQKDLSLFETVIVSANDTLAIYFKRKYLFHIQKKQFNW